MILTLSENLDQPTVEKLAAFLNGLPHGSNRADHYIYLNSGGGNYHSMEAILHILLMVEGINLIGYGELLSCAFDLFFMYTGPKTLVRGTIGMYHQTSCRVALNEKGRPDNPEAELRAKQLTSHFRGITTRQMEFLKFTKSEKKRVNDNKDQWFQYDRMLDFLIISQENSIEKQQEIIKLLTQKKD